MKYPKTDTGWRLFSYIRFLDGQIGTVDVNGCAESIIELEDTAEGHKQAYEAMKAELEIAIKHVDAKKMFPQFFGNDKDEINKSCYSCGYIYCNISNDSKQQYCKFWKEKACKK